MVVWRGLLRRSRARPPRRASVRVRVRVRVTVRVRARGRVRVRARARVRVRLGRTLCAERADACNYPLGPPRLVRVRISL